MTHVAEGSVIIYRPVTHVWIQLAVAQNVPMILPGTHSVTTDEPLGVLRKGSTLRGELNFLGIEASWSSRIVEFDESKLMSATSAVIAPEGNQFDVALDLTLEPVAEGSLMSASFRCVSGFDEMFGATNDEVVTISYSRSLQASLHNFADWLDTGRRRNLTSRHREVLRMVQQGMTDREIAEKLYISPKTVGHHVSAILAAFRVTQRQELRRSVEFPE